MIFLIKTVTAVIIKTYEGYVLKIYGSSTLKKLDILQVKKKERKYSRYLMESLMNESLLSYIYILFKIIFKLVTAIFGFDRLGRQQVTLSL